MKKLLVLLAAVLTAAACSHKPAANQDAYMWLEDIEGKQALNWVDTQNKESVAALASTPNFKTMEKDALAILEAKDKIPSVNYMGKNLFNFWRDEAHTRGLLRTTTLANFKKKNVPWTIVLDIDALAKKENENWVFKGINCFKPAETACLISLSRGGKDAVTMREFDMNKKAFVAGGFSLPEAKTMISWVDKDTLLVGTDFGKGTLTDSGYPRQTKLWKRGTPLASATLVYEGKPSDVWVSPEQLNHGGENLSIVSRGLDFFNTEEFIFDPKTGKVSPAPKPEGAELAGYFRGLMLYKLRKNWNFDSQVYPAGALVSIDPRAGADKMGAGDVQLVFTPKANQAFGDVVTMKTKIAFSVLEDVKGRVYTTAPAKDKKWSAPKAADISGTGNIILQTSSEDADQFLYYYENFNQASSLYSYNFSAKPTLLKTLPARFDAKDVVVDQKFATSKDGTKIPYFLIYKKNTKFDGTAPTLQYGYGGFTVSQAPSYNALAGKLWIEKGGVYVVANIRGGGEYGPAWHQAALKENRQKAYDDFIAVSENLIATKVTAPARLAIRGGSNGGLLVGAVMVQRPDLYGAVLCGVPLLDMMRFSQLLAGASWMGEYGDPTIASNRAAILKYSPYQNVQAGKTYPPVFFFTSTKDDRVHPGHARKMAAKMKEQKHRVLYYENTEGGHAASANYKQQAFMMALQMQFLFNTINAAETAPVHKTAAGY